MTAVATERYQDEAIIPFDNRSHSWFKNTFEKNLSTILPFPSQEISYEAQRFQTTNVDLLPEKLTAVVLRSFPTDRYELLVGDEMWSGYRFLDHNRILESYGTNDDMETTFSAIYFEAQTKRYLIVTNLECVTGFDHNKTKTQKFAQAMGEYQISTIFTSSSGALDWEPHLSPKAEDIIEVGNFVQAYDNLVRDSYISGLAQQFGWTNNEMIRYRLSNELPEWKPPAYRQKSAPGKK